MQSGAESGENSHILEALSISSADYKHVLRYSRTASAILLGSLGNTRHSEVDLSRYSEFYIRDIAE